VTLAPAKKFANNALMCACAMQSICLKLAKEPSLAADFKAQVARLLPQARATLEAGLRATMATAASPASNRSRAASGSSAGAGRRKPAIALRTDFG
jgi:hypothetical protein